MSTPFYPQPPAGEPRYETSIQAPSPDHDARIDAIRLFMSKVFGELVLSYGQPHPAMPGLRLNDGYGTFSEPEHGVSTPDPVLYAGAIWNRITRVTDTPARLTVTTHDLPEDAADRLENAINKLTGAWSRLADPRGLAPPAEATLHSLPAHPVAAPLGWSDDTNLAQVESDLFSFPPLR